MAGYGLVQYNPRQEGCYKFCTSPIHIEALTPNGMMVLGVIRVGCGIRADTPNGTGALIRGEDQSPLSPPCEVTGRVWWPCMNQEMGSHQE